MAAIRAGGCSQEQGQHACLDLPSSALVAERKPYSKPELIPRGRRPGAGMCELCDTVELLTVGERGQELHSPPVSGLRRPCLDVYTWCLSAIPVPHTQGTLPPIRPTEGFLNYGHGYRACGPGAIGQ